MLPTKIYTFTIAANQTYRMEVRGEYFKILQAAGLVEVVADFGTLTDIGTGQGLEDTPFSTLTIRDRSGQNNQIRLLIGDQKFIDGATGAIQVLTNKVAQSANFANAQKTVGVASAQLLAANPGRQYLLVQNRSTAAIIFINFGATAASVVNGLRIPAGSSYELAGIASVQEIQAISDSAGADVLTIEG